MARHKRMAKKTKEEKKCKVSKCVKEYVKREITKDVETKYLDLYVSFTGIQGGNSATFGFTCLNAMVQGAGEQARIGNNCAFKSLKLKCAFYPEVPTVGDPQTSGGSPSQLNAYNSSVASKPYAWANSNEVRIIVFLYKQPQGQLFSKQDLFEHTYTIGYGDTKQMYNMDQDVKKLFHVLYDKKFTSRAISDYVQGDMQIDINKKLNFNTNYGLSNLGTYADINTNALYVCFLSDANANHPIDVYYTCQLGYTDS